MQRTNTIEEETASGATVWHLCWQAAMGREFFVHPSLYARVRERVIEAHRRPGRVLVNYTLLPTEIHVVTEIAPGDSASAVARAIGNVVARWVRTAQPVRNPVFAGPYRAHPIRSEAELRTDTRMLAWRAAVLGGCKTPSHHAHGALRIALGLTPARGFDARPLLSAFGDSIPQARAALRALVRQRPSERERRVWELTRGLASTGGSVAAPFTVAGEVRSLSAAALLAAGGADSVEEALGMLCTWITAKLDARCVLDLYSASDSTGARGRALVACMAVEYRLCSAASVARYFGRAKATLSEQMSACRARKHDQQIIATPVRRVIEEAAALASATFREKAGSARVMRK
ncbi:hypothetical protein BH11PSE8_BH11PSE8_32930 [soil metagenome]